MPGIKRIGYINQRERAKIKASKKAIDRELRAEFGPDSYNNLCKDDEWYSQDIDAIDAEFDGEEQFLDDLKIDNDIPIQSTGTRWYHRERGVGRIIKSICDSNRNNNTTTILVIRDNEQVIYRLGIRRDKEIPVLRRLASQGYTFTKIKINYEDKS